MAILDRASGTKVAEAIEKRIKLISKDLYNNSPFNRTKFGSIISKNNGLFSIKIDDKIYPNIPALRSSGDIKRGDVAICLIPNNQYSNMLILGVADGTEIFPDNFLEYIYPIGSIYMSTENVSPASFLGGTWVPLMDRFLIGAGNLYGVSSMGGEVVHALSTDEMPKHSHGALVFSQSGELYSIANFTFSQGDFYYVPTSETGGGQPHNNMPPYLGVYMWERVKDGI